MGKTSRQVVEMENMRLSGESARVELITLALLPDAAEQYPIGVGRIESYGFTEDDLENLRGSFVDTLQNALAPRTVRSDQSIKLHLLIRRYMVAYTNHSIAMMAAINWCATEKDGSVLYREDFYVPRSWNVIGPPPGDVKNAIAQAIIRRVAASSLILAALPQGRHDLPKPTRGTFTNFDEAIAKLPEEARSWGFLIIAPPLPVDYLPGSASQSLVWDPVESPRSNPCSGSATESK